MKLPVPSRHLPPVSTRSVSLGVVAGAIVNLGLIADLRAQATIPEVEAALELSGEFFSLSTRWQVTADPAQTHDGQDALQVTSSGESLTLKRGPARWIRLRYRTTGKPVEVTSGVSAPGGRSLTVTWPDTAGAWALGEIPVEAGASAVIRSTGALALDSGEMLALPTPALGDAMGQPSWAWSQGGSATWAPTAWHGYAGPAGAVASFAAANQSAWLETIVPGPGLLTFTRWMPSSVTLAVTIDGVAVPLTASDPGLALAGSGPRTVRWTCTHSAASPGPQPVFAGLSAITFLPTGPAAPSSVLDGWTGLAWTLDASAGTYELISTPDGAQNVETIAVRRANRPAPAPPPALTTTLPGPGRIAFEFQGPLFDASLGGTPVTAYTEPATGEWSKADIIWAQPEATSFSLSVRQFAPVNQRLLIRRLTWQPASPASLAVAAEPQGLTLPGTLPPYGGLGGLAWSPDGQDAVFHTNASAAFQVPVPGILRTITRRLPNLTLAADASEGLPFPWHHTATWIETPDLGSNQSTLRIDAGSEGKDRFHYLPITATLPLTEATDFPGADGTALGVGGPTGATLSRDGTDLAILAKPASGIEPRLILDQPDDSYLEWWARLEGGSQREIRVGAIDPTTNATSATVGYPLTRAWRRYATWHEHRSGATHVVLTGSAGNNSSGEGLALVDQVRSFDPESVPLADALDLPPGLTADTFPTTPWQGRATGGWSRDGEDVAALPSLEPGQSSWLQLNLPGPGRLLLASQVASTQAHPALTITRQAVLPDGSTLPLETVSNAVAASEQSNSPIFKDLAYLIRTSGASAFRLTVAIEAAGEPVRHRHWIDAVRFEPAIPLAEAADLPGVIWRTDAANPWIGLRSPGLSPDGVDAVLSPTTLDPTYASGWIEAEVKGPLTLEYWSRDVSAPLCDGEPWNRSESLRPSGRSRLHVPAGQHVLRWRHLAAQAILDQFRIVADDGPMAAVADTCFWMASERVTPAAPGDAAGSPTAWTLALPSDASSLDENIRLLAPGHGLLRFRARTSTPVLAMGNAATTDGVGQRYLTDVWRSFSVAVDVNSSRTVFLPPTGTGPAGRSLRLDAIEFIPAASPSLDEALDSPAGLTWTASHPNWQPVASAASSHDGVDAVSFEWARDTGHESWIETIVPGPGRLSFWMRSDEGQFFADVNGRRLRESTEPRPSEGTQSAPWRLFHFDLPEGVQTVRLGFRWSRRAELDEVRFEPQPTPAPAAAFGANPATPTAWVGTPAVLPTAGPDGGPAVHLGADPWSSHASFQQAVPTPSLARFWLRRYDTVPPTTAHLVGMGIGSRLSTGLISVLSPLKPGWQPVEVPMLQSTHDSLRLTTQSSSGNGLLIADLEIEPVTLVSLGEALDNSQFSFSAFNGLAGIASAATAHDGMDAVVVPWSVGTDSTRPRLTTPITPTDGGVLSFWVRGGDDGCRVLSFILKNPPLSPAKWQYVEVPVAGSISEIRWDLKNTMAPDGAFVPTSLDQVEYRVDPHYYQFLIWLFANRLQPSANAALSDSDGDGWPALLEFACGLSPSWPDPINTTLPFEIPSPPRLDVQELPDGTRQLRADFVRSTLAEADVSLGVSVSLDEGRTWQPFTGGTTVEEPIPGYPDHRRVTRIVPIAQTAGVQLFRLQASLR